MQVARLRQRWEESCCIARLPCHATHFLIFRLCLKKILYDTLRHLSREITKTDLGTSLYFNLHIAVLPMNSRVELIFAQEFDISRKRVDVADMGWGRDFRPEAG